VWTTDPRQIQQFIHQQPHVVNAVLNAFQVTLRFPPGIPEPKSSDKIWKYPPMLPQTVRADHETQQ